MIDTLQNHQFPIPNAQNGSHGLAASAGEGGIAGAVTQSVETFLRRTFGEKYLDADSTLGVFAKIAVYSLLLILAYIALLAHIEGHFHSGRETGPHSKKEV